MVGKAEPMQDVEGGKDEGRTRERPTKRPKQGRTGALMVVTVAPRQPRQEPMSRCHWSSPRLSGQVSPSVSGYWVLGPGFVSISHGLFP